MQADVVVSVDDVSVPVDTDVDVVKRWMLGGCGGMVDTEVTDVS